jgi:histidinol-phosphatase (PHP family)
MKPFTYHTHSTFCDGKNTLSEMAEAAHILGIDSLGLSCHSHVVHDPVGCISPDRVPDFIREVRRLQKAYAPMGMDIFLGIEQDALSAPIDQPHSFDYVIGSMHYVTVDGIHVTIDSKKSYFYNLEKYFNGDAIALAVEYYNSMKELYSLTKCQIVGHLDIVTKFNEGGVLFDERDPKYEKAAAEAIECLARDGLIFEINTGAMARGYRTQPYPSKRLLSMIREVGGSITYASDCHDAGYLTFGFDSVQRLAADCGFDSLMKLKRTPEGCKFYPENIEVLK